MELVMLTLLVGVAVAVAYCVVGLRRIARQDARTGHSAAAAAPQSSASLPDAEWDLPLEVRASSDDDNAGAVEVWTPSLDHYLFRLETAESPSIEPTSSVPGWIPRVIESALQQAKNLHSTPLPPGTLLVRFPRAVAAGLESGTHQLMRTSSGLVPEAVSRATGHVAGKARVIGKVGASGQVAGLGAVGGATTIVALLPVAAAAGAAYAHQRWLDKTLKRIDEHVLAIADRLRDDDHGRLDAALQAVAGVDQTMSAEVLPDYHRLQLAIAVRDVDAIYLARRRLLRRFASQVERAQDDVEARTGEAQAWARGVERAFGDPLEFRKEVLVYLHALVARARVHATAASALALDGYAAIAFAQVEELGLEVRADYFDLNRRMQALARSGPGGRSLGSGKRILQAVTADLAELMENEVSPALPPPLKEEIVVPIGSIAEFVAAAP